jgi:hypothetical protein
MAVQLQEYVLKFQFWHGLVLISRWHTHPFLIALEHAI